MDRIVSYHNMSEGQANIDRFGLICFPTISCEIRWINKMTWKTVKHTRKMFAHSLLARIHTYNTPLLRRELALNFCGNDMICLNCKCCSLVHVCGAKFKWLKKKFIRKNWFHVCRCVICTKQYSVEFHELHLLLEHSECVCFCVCLFS